MLEIDQTPQNDIVERLIQSRSFKKNPVTWSVFYATAIVSVVMFCILCILSSWTVKLGQEASEMLADIREITPEVRKSLELLRYMCKHENFTRKWGECPWN